MSMSKKETLLREANVPLNYWQENLDEDFFVKCCREGGGKILFGITPENTLFFRPYRQPYLKMAGINE